MENQEIREIDIRELLPQQEPFIMVDRLTAYDERLTSTEFKIKENNIFVEGGLFSAEGILENIAQTCAARIGYINKYILHCGINIGFIGAVKGFHVHHNVNTGDLIYTTIKVREEVFGLTLADAEVRLNGSEGEIVATSEMKIAVKE
ncbi:MAG: pseudouridylate synthase [Muribaculaceae bacterium]|nr:pseudouridylate synthase [Muribaculaceae bacterium]